MSTVNINLTPRNVVVNFDGETRIYNVDDPMYDKVKQLYRAGDMQALKDMLVAFKNKIESAYKAFKVVDDTVFVGDEALPASLGNRLRFLADEDLDCKPLLRFWSRVRKNPSYRAVNEGFTHLDAHHHPFLDDGRFLAYKGVRADFYDKHSGKFNNAVGQKPEVPRQSVDDDCNKHCSYGLHVGSYEYARDFAGSDGVLVEVAVDPADIVSVPTDCGCAKMRVCKYEVLAVCKGFHKEQVVNDYNFDEDEDSEYDSWMDDDDEDEEECGCGDCSCVDDEDCTPPKSGGSQSNYRHNKRGPGGRFAKK